MKLGRSRTELDGDPVKMKGGVVEVGAELVKGFDVEGGVGVELIVGVGVGSEERRNVVQVEGGIVKVGEVLVKGVDVDGSVGSEERRN